MKSYLGATLATVGSLASLACNLQDSSDISASQQPLENVCAQTMVEGIDISEFQGNIDWDAVAASGVKFAIIRTSDGSYRDPMFAYNWQRAKEVGIIRGVYHYLQTHIDGVEQANTMFDMMGQLQTGDLPPTVDIEDPSGIPDAESYMALVNAFGNRVQQVTGHLPFAYSNWSYPINNFGSHPGLAQYPFWIAHINSGCPDIPDPWTNWTFWQYSWVGTIPGIAGDVDLDRFNGDMNALRALTHNATPAVCGDNQCVAGETSETCVADCPPCQLLTVGQKNILDDAGPCFVRGGHSEYMRKAEVGWSSSLTWTNTTADPAPANYGVWKMHFDKPGAYRVEVYTEPEYGQSKQATYQITHAGRMDTVTIDQSAQTGWQDLGRFVFTTGGNGQQVRVDDNTGEAGDATVHLSFDAVRVTYLGGDSTAGPDGADGEEKFDNPNFTSSGCQTAGGGSGKAMLTLFTALVVFGFARVVRR